MRLSCRYTPVLNDAESATRYVENRDAKLHGWA
jgi:hypothetical protein